MDTSLHLFAAIFAGAFGGGVLCIISPNAAKLEPLVISLCACSAVLWRLSFMLVTH